MRRSSIAPARRASAGRVVIALAAVSVAGCSGLLGPSRAEPPANLSATNSTSATEIGLSWAEAAGAVRYLVYRSPTWTEPGEYSKIGETEETTFADSAVPVDTNYWYKVSAVGSDGQESAWSVSDFGSRRGTGGPVAVPYAVDATEGEYGSITISWKLDASVTRVSLYYGRNADGSDGQALFENIPATSYTWDDEILFPKYAGSVAGTLFHFWVKGVVGSEVSAASAPGTGFSFGGDASAPTGLVASQGLAGEVSLSWEAVPGVSQYLLYRNASLTDEPHPFKTISRGYTYHHDDWAVPGVRYYYRVASQANTSNPYNPLLTSNPSPPVMGFVRPRSDIGVPGGLKATRTSRYTVCLAWDPVAGAEGYHVHRATGSDDTTVDSLGLVSGAANAVFVDSAVSAATTYRYRISAYVTTGSTNGSVTGEGDWSEPLTVTTPATSTLEPPVPGAPVPGPDGTTSLGLSWTAAPGAVTGYRVYRSPSESGVFSAIAEVAAPATTWLDSGLAPDTQYFYKVQAFGAADESDLSAAVAGRTDPLVPAAPSPCSAVQNEPVWPYIRLAWARTDHAAKYVVLRQEEGSVDWTPLPDVAADAGEATQSWEDRGYNADGSGPISLLSGVVYRYKVRAVNRLGAAGPDSEVFDGWLSPWAFSVPLVTFQGAGADTSAADRTASFDWTMSQIDARITGYRLFRAPLAFENGQWTRGPYLPVVDVEGAANMAHTQYFDSANGYSDADKGRLFSWAVAAKDQNGALGPRSAGPVLMATDPGHPLDVMVGRTDLPLASIPAAPSPTPGIVYGGHPVRFVFEIRPDTPTYVFVQDGGSQAYHPLISVMHPDGSYYLDENTMQPGRQNVPLRAQAANASWYRDDAYWISSPVAETVTLEVAVAGSGATVQMGANFLVEASETAVTKPW